MDGVVGESLHCQGLQVPYPQLWPGDSDEGRCPGDPLAVPETCPMALASPWCCLVSLWIDLTTVCHKAGT